MKTQIFALRSLIFGAVVIALGGAAFGGWAGEMPSNPSAVPTDPAVEDGVLNAASLRPVPPASTVSVLAWDNSDENVELTHQIEDQLRQRGFTVAPKSALVLKFSATDTPGQWSSGPRRRMVEVDGQAGSGTDNEAQVRLNLFSSDKGGVFNEGRPQEKIPSSYGLEMTLDGQDGQRLWQGEATAKLTNLERRQLVKLMVPPLLDNIGKTVRSQPFGVKPSQ
jgi:hypothetical protein